MRLQVLVLVLVAACVTSYESATTARPIGPSRWIIEVEGRHLGPSLVLEYQQRKAGEVCPNGFRVEQTSGGEEVKGYYVNGNTATPIKRTDAAAVVVCN
jgi:hypothetical protein